MFLLLKELLQPDGLPAPTHPLGRGVFNETPSLLYTGITFRQLESCLDRVVTKLVLWTSLL